MSLPAYPSVLPLWDAPDFEVDPRTSFVSTEFEQGPVRNRRRFLNVPHRNAGTALLDWEQLAIFEYWWVNVIDGGSAWFTMDLPFAGSYQTVEAHFLEHYSYRRQAGGLLKLSAVWEVRDVPLISEAQYNALTS